MISNNSIDFDKIYNYLDSIKHIHNWISQYYEEFEAIKEAYNLFEDEDSRLLFISELFLKINSIIVGWPTAMLIQSPEQYKWLKNNNECDLFWRSEYASLFNEVLNNEKYRGYGGMLYDIFVNEQYRYHKDNLDIKPRETDICFDIGACFGETSILFAKICQAQKVYAFDIFSENINIINQLSKINKLENKILPFKVGFSNKDDIVSYTHYEANSACSIILDLKKYLEKYGNKYPIENTSVTTIDKFCEEQKVIPTFIKSDIEGTDLLALEGGAKTITNNKPTLALAVYHSSDHFYKMPLKIAEYNNDYKLRLKKHSKQFETVCYAY